MTLRIFTKSAAVAPRSADFAYLAENLECLMSRAKTDMSPQSNTSWFTRLPRRKH